MNNTLIQPDGVDPQVEEICTAAGSIITLIIALIRARRSARRKRRVQRKAAS